MNINKLLFVLYLIGAHVCCGELLTPVGATASSSASDTPPVNLINNSGLSLPISEASLHSNEDNTYWASSYSGGTGWLVLDLGSTWAVDGAILWQYNRPNLGNLGVSDFDILASTDMNNWTTVMSDAYLPRSQTDTFGGVQESDAFNFTSTPARYLKLDIKDNHGSNALVALSEVKFTGTAIPEPSSAILILLTGGLIYFKTRILGGR